ncbi:extracellular exo-alpha-L-arabinofuranosidase [Scytonema sp. HK-05]|uniref:RICIN domain-containing protein n=1 Tax=Scytonema sp. HK-05 TaxID=1137095 RepID=UPI000936F0C3|nr:RICIN domain-containing protein [Scytonema sp. HK-05]OKH60128.1 hypothetical protein NIES2130_05055 [Scytonema sp. HK-05]BAY42914.1 extracellular exo-alpha-L-arabinofuranosidase [Scytonema sp. HK-05]
MLKVFKGEEKAFLDNSFHPQKISQHIQQYKLMKKLSSFVLAAILFVCTLLSITPHALAQTAFPTPGKNYYLTAKVSGKVLDVSGGSTDNGANIQQWEKGGVDQQKWRLEDAGNGYYYLVSQKSGKVAAADYKGVTGTNLNNVVQYDKVGAEEQKWKLEDAGNGYFSLVNKATGKLLDVEGAGLTDGTNVQQCEKNGTDAQKWKFETADTAPSVPNTPKKISIDAATNTGNGKRYFFKGNQYIRYDSDANKVDAGYPKPIKEWKGLEAFANGIDAVFEWTDSVFFFKGNQYIRLDDDGNKVLEGYPKPIKGNWNGLEPFANGIDAVIGGGDYHYFFKGNQSITFNKEANKADGSPLPINTKGHWVGLEPFADGIDAAYEKPPYIYFFKGDQYIRYDTRPYEPAEGPKPIKDNWNGLEAFAQ